MDSVLSTIAPFVNTGATLATWYLFASLTPELHRVHSEKSIKNVPLLPILSMLASATTWGIYGVISSNIFPLVVTAGMGILFGLGYTAVYFHNAGHLKSQVKRQFLYTIAGLALHAGFCFCAPVSHQVVELVGGYVAVLTTAVMFGSPLVTFKRVIAEHNSAYLPVAMAIAGMLSSGFMVISGVTVKDAFVIVPNAINFALSIIQISLIVIFPRRPLDSSEAQLEMGHKLSEQTPLVVP